ncbi:MAG TPA: transposase, partial [Bacillales bacterium]|nr:transposase [Bacillales bacterium]
MIDIQTDPSCFFTQLYGLYFLVGYGVNDQGYREILGLKVGDSESEHTWNDYFSWLKARGLHGLDVI